MKIPSHTWAWISLALSVYFIVGAPIKLALMGLGPNQTMQGFLEAEMLAVAWVGGSYYWLRRRMAARKQWREQRYWGWIMSDLPDYE